MTQEQLVLTDWLAQPCCRHMEQQMTYHRKECLWIDLEESLGGGLRAGIMGPLGTIGATTFKGL